MKFIYRLCLIIFITLSVTGCTVIHVHDNTGKTEVTRGIGYIDIDLPEGQDGYMMSLNGLGAFTAAGSFSLGYVDLQMAGLKPSCHIAFWIENEEQAIKIKELLGDMGGICFPLEPVNQNEQGETK
ncbi:MAG: hypothetical protein V1706_16440 [Pseudomonadota bacterium]